jgi:hypothetical protein
MLTKPEEDEYTMLCFYCKGIKDAYTDLGKGRNDFSPNFLESLLEKRRRLETLTTKLAE